MADSSDDAEKRDEEQEVRDADADERDSEQAEKRDEEQEVRDADADTKDVDSRLNAIEDMVQRINGTLQKLVSTQAAIVDTGAIVDVDDTDPTDDDGMGAPQVKDVLDLSIDNLK